MLKDFWHTDLADFLKTVLKGTGTVVPTETANSSLEDVVVSPTDVKLAVFLFLGWAAPEATGNVSEN